MKKWLVILALLILGLILGTIPVLADTSAEVTITATGWVCGAPGGFTLTYISDYEVGISWTKGIDAENTMIRAAYGRVPESRTDGYLVYYGPDDGIGEIISDTGVNFDEGVSDVYYRAWSQNAAGIWEETGTSNLMESPYMLLIVLAGLAFGFTIASAVLKKGFLAFAAASVWVITSIYCFTRYTEVWDTYFSLAFLFIGLMLACAFSPLAYRETTPAGERPEEPDVRDLREEMEAFDRERNQYDFLYSKRRPKRGTSRFARTKL